MGQILYFLGAILGGGVIGAIISSLATIFFGERRVETMRRRREHSIKLNDVVLKPWLSKCQDYCKIGAIYDHKAANVSNLCSILLLNYEEDIVLKHGFLQFFFGNRPGILVFTHIL